MNTRTALLAAVGTLALGTANAYAQNPEGYYGSIGLGYAFEGENDFESDGNAVPTEFDTDFETEGDAAGYVALGKYHDYGLRSEIEFSRREQDVSNLPGDNFFAGFPSSGDLGNVTVTAAMINVYKDFGLDGDFRPYIGAGVGGALVNLDFDNIADTAAATVPADAANGYRVSIRNQDFVPAFQLLAGLGLKLSDNVFWQLGYRYLQTGQFETEAYINNPVADVQGDYAVHEATFGLRFAFGATAAPVQTVAPTPQVQTKTCLDGTVVPMSQACPQVEEDALTPAELRTVVYFELDSAVLSPTAEALLRRRANEASEVDLIDVIVTGGTDTTGSASYNQRLSQRRAAVVREALVRYGVSADKIRVLAVGENNLARPTADGVNEPLNRRTEVEFDF